MKHYREHLSPLEGSYESRYDAHRAAMVECLMEHDPSLNRAWVVSVIGRLWIQNAWQNCMPPSRQDLIQADLEKLYAGAVSGDLLWI